MFLLPSEHIQTCVKPASTLSSGRRVTLAKGIAGWISGPRKTFLLIQKFRKDAKDHIFFPTETRFLPGAHSWKSERGSPVQSSPDLCQGGTHTAGPPGEGREAIQTLHSVIQESMHMASQRGFLPIQDSGVGEPPPSQVHGYHMG